MALQAPNVLLIQSDQHRYDCVGRSGDYPVQTPNMDKLAQEGIWFTNAYTPIPLCCPARQALLNGRRPEAFGALWNFNATLPVGYLEQEDYSWPRQLKELGYRTGYCGKWHVHPKIGPEAFGFDASATDQQYQKFVSANYPELRYDNGWFGEASPVALEDAHTHYMTDRAIEMMSQFTEEGKPWHIRLDFHAPHLPCRPSEPYASMYRSEEVPMWRSFEEDFAGKPYIQQQQLYNWKVENYSWDDWAPTVALYYGAISQVDDAVGRALLALEKLGQADNTIVIYTSDHGDLCGGHRMMDKHYVMYDDVVRVPLIVRWPRKIQPNCTSDAFVYNILDLPPTLLEAAGLQVPDFFHGRSLMPIFEERPLSNWRAEVLCTYNGQQFGLYAQRMIRTENWKYVWNLTDVDELYNLREDPEELINCIDDPTCSDTLAQLRHRIYTLLAECKDPIIDNEWIKAQLLESRKLIRERSG